MSKIRRVLSRPRSAAVALGALLGLLAPAQAAVVSSRARAPVDPSPVLAVQAPAIDLRAEVLAVRPSPSPSPTQRARPPKPAARASKPKPRPPKPDVRPFRGLGAWIDLWDYSSLDVADTVAMMDGYGVRTIYIQTGRFNTRRAVDPAVGPWLVAAHRAGMDVVGWYLPSYSDMGLDVRRSTAIASYRYRGHAFDAVGIDIEWKNDVKNPAWNARVVRHLQRVRAKVDRRVAVAAIVPPPLQMTVAPRRWAGFPWKGIGEHSDVIMLMSYWSYRDCENIPDHCAYPFTSLNLEETRRLVGDARIPIHTIGGIGDRITHGEVRDFVRGARDGDAFGASLYDVRTTPRDFWPILARLRSL